MKQPILVAIVFCLAGSQSFAQGIVNSEQNVAPMAVNPAFTGMFTGSTRVNTFYSSHRAKSSFNYESYGASVDLPLVTGKGGSYLAGGLLLRKDVVAEGDLGTFNGVMSVAYHKIFRKTGDSNNAHAADLAIGIQGGYEQSTINLSRIFFSAPSIDPRWNYLPAPGQPIVWGLGTHPANYYTINAGISFAKSFSPRMKFIAGISANNLNRPTVDIGREYYFDRSGLELQFIGTVAANVLISKRFSLRPATFFYMNSINSRGLVGGNDFCYNLSRNPDARRPTSVFIGLWYRSGDVEMVTAGMTYNRFHIGVAYDYLSPAVRKSGAAGDGGMCLNLKYTAPGKKTGRVVPNDRF